MEGRRTAEAPMDGDTVRVLEMFSLEIKVQAFWWIDSGGKQGYTKGKRITWNVEVGALTVEKLLSSVSNEIEFGESQVATVWFNDKRMCEDVRLVDDVQLAHLFEMYKTEMHCELIVSVLDKSLCEAHEFDGLDPICVVPPVDTTENHTAAQPTQNRGDGVSADASEPDMSDILNMFDNAEEYVGVNDEHLFTSVPPHNHNHQLTLMLLLLTNLTMWLLKELILRRQRLMMQIQMN
ncbi:unnamed protein product [Urochloa humidicola]